MSDVYAAVERIFEDFRIDAHVPGLAYGIVTRAGLQHGGGLGIQSLGDGRAVDSDTIFRIASMTKAFTALTVLRLRDEGLLRLDDEVAIHVPELRDWAPATQDAGPIRIRDLLNHIAGFVTDDPWGDRQNPLPEAEFSRLLAGGVALTRAPGCAFEYSNLGYALLGRIITNCTGQPFAAAITRILLDPLGMASTAFDGNALERSRQAQGYRWEDHNWRAEPELAHGTFGAMGGLHTSLSDYTRWMTFLLAAWPSRDGVETGPVRRASVREMAQGSNFPRLRRRPGRHDDNNPWQAVTYGMGLDVAVDGVLGTTLGHSGGYPGYGSYMLLLPDRGVGLFAFANRTYARPLTAVWDALMRLHDAGELPPIDAEPPGAALCEAYLAVQKIYHAGRVDAAIDTLAMNFLPDRDAAAWARDLALLRAELGDCRETGPLQPTGRLSGEFFWRCEHGRLHGTVTLAPTQSPLIQALRLERVPPAR